MRNHAHAHRPTAVEARQRRSAALGRSRVVGRTKAKPPEPVADIAICNPEDVVVEFKRLYAKAVAAVESAESMKDARLAPALKEANGILSQIARSYGVFNDETRPTLVVDRSQRIVNVLGSMSEDELRRILTDAPPAALVAAIDVDLTL